MRERAGTTNGPKNLNDLWTCNNPGRGTQAARAARAPQPVDPGEGFSLAHAARAARVSLGSTHDLVP